MKAPVISVVIPIYNGEQYLRKCLQSIVCQTFRDIEVILVNDGSTDNSLEICEEYAHLDNRIVIINKRNEGASFARRDGMLKARGNYIFYIDTDDYLEPDTLEKLITIASEHQVDMVVCNFDRVLDNWGLLRKKMKNDAMADRLVGKDELRRLFIGSNGWLVTIVWGKLYRLDCIKKAMEAHGELMFPPKTVTCEDRYLNLALAPFLNSLWITNDVLYHYRFGGMTNSFLPMIKGGFFYNAKYDMCREYGLDDCLPKLFSYYVADFYYDLRLHIHFDMSSGEQSNFIDTELCQSKIVAWARKNLHEEYRKEVEAEALLQNDVDKILNIAMQKEKARWKKHLLERLMRLYQRIIKAIQNGYCCVYR